MTLPEDEEYESIFSFEGITDQEPVSKNNWIGPDVAVPSKLDKDFTTEPVSVIGLIAFSFFVVPGAVIFGGWGSGYCSSR